MFSKRYVLSSFDDLVNLIWLLRVCSENHSNDKTKTKIPRPNETTFDKISYKEARNPESKFFFEQYLC